MQYQRFLPFYFAIVIFLFSLKPLLAKPEEMGDRLVLAVNGILYTQRQVEVYILIKESLRPTPVATVITASNWPQALEAFGEDMIVLQEAQRLGSYQTLDQAGTRYDNEVRARVKSSDALKQSLSRLGVDDSGIRRSLEQVLRVAAFRRSKDRQAEITNQADGYKSIAQSTSHASNENVPRWLETLKSRAIIRPLEGALDYIVIQPKLGQ